MEIPKFYIEIPTYENGIWTDTIFTDLIEFREFVKSCFKEPGKYELDETSRVFNQQARNFNLQNGVYDLSPNRSKDFITYWDFEKKKNINGAIFKNKGKTWYLPRDYYMWINFLPIYDKIKKDYDFAQVWDVQLHMALYELLAELHWLHAVIFKKRQIASSYFHCAKMLNRIWFDRGAVLKMGASLKDYVNEKGSWMFLDEYRSFLNTKTAWYRPMNPGGEGEWQQKIEVLQGNRRVNIGLKGRMTAMSFEKSPTKGVGGPCTIFFYEEAGIAPTLDQTYIYAKSALEMGDFTTGLFVAAGSVGKLKDAEPLKKLLLNPDANGIYAVENNLLDENGTVGRTGLFIPEQWGMPPYIDDFGNSLVEEALESLDKRFEKFKKEKDPEDYQLEVSQHPRNIKEGFAHRELSQFPVSLVEQNKREIEEGYPHELLDLDEDALGQIVVKKTNKAPIKEWPVKKSREDKEGAIVVWERPDRNPIWGTYIVSIDPVAEGKTVTSDSLCSIYVYKMPTEVRRYLQNGEVENFIEGDKIVAAWCGRFDDINDTHKRLRLIIEWYNAMAIVENNISLFIQYMIAERKQRYLVKKSEMLFLKEVQSNKSVFQDYGWRNTGRIFKDHLLSYLIEFLKEVVDQETDDFGVVLKKYFGIRRIPDIMAMVEMLGYTEGANVDRLVSLAALVAFVKIRLANMHRTVRVENEGLNNLEKNKDLYKLDSSAFRNVGRRKAGIGMTKPRSSFKRIR